VHHAALHAPGPLTLLDDSACRLSHDCQKLHLLQARTCLLACCQMSSLCYSCSTSDDQATNAYVEPHLLAGTTSTLYVVSGFRWETITLRDFTLCGDGSLLAPAAGRTSTAGQMNTPWDASTRCASWLVADMNSDMQSARMQLLLSQRIRAADHGLRDQHAYVLTINSE
jgi:hypothetical protein